MVARDAEGVGEVFGDRDVAGVELVFADDKHGAALVGFADQGDDFLARSRELDVADVELLAKLGKDAQEPFDGGAGRADELARAEGGVFKSGFEEEEDRFQGGLEGT